MELSGQVGYGKGYMAVAFATSSKMADADLYYCTGDELRSGVIRKQHEQPVDLSYKVIIKSELPARLFIRPKFTAQAFNFYILSAVNLPPFNNSVKLVPPCWCRYSTPGYYDHMICKH